MIYTDQASQALLRVNPRLAFTEMDGINGTIIKTHTTGNAGGLHNGRLLSIDIPGIHG